MCSWTREACIALSHHHYFHTTCKNMHLTLCHGNEILQISLTNVFFHFLRPEFPRISQCLSGNYPLLAIYAINAYRVRLQWRWPRKFATFRALHCSSNPLQPIGGSGVSRTVKPALGNLHLECHRFLMTCCSSCLLNVVNRAYELAECSSNSWLHNRPLVATYPSSAHEETDLENCLVDLPSTKRQGSWSFTINRRKILREMSLVASRDFR